MYAGLDIIGAAKQPAWDFIMTNDRMLYRPFFEAAERFCVERSVLIGGRVGADLLVDKPIDLTSFYWEIYTDNAFAVAKDFTQAMSEVKSPHVPANTASMRTNIKHREFTVIINAQMFFKVYALDQYRGIKLATLMGPTPRMGYFGSTVACIPATIQLISIYRNLYTPAKAGSWPSEFELEAKLFARIGGGDIVGAGGDNVKATAHQMQELVLDDILIGDYAFKALGLAGTPQRVQIISSRSPEDICLAWTRILRSKSSRGYKLTHVKFALNILDDFQLVKHTIYVNDGRDQAPLADVYNASAHEMIPFRVSTQAGRSVRVAGLWVLMRFLFIDMWVLRLINALGGHTGPHARVDALMRRAYEVRALIMKAPADTFQDTDYEGCYVDERVAKNKFIKGIGDNFPTFYPAVAGQKQGSEQSVAAILAPIMRSGPINITIDAETKWRILDKITGASPHSDIMARLVTWKSEHSPARTDANTGAAKWGQGKSLKAFFYKNAPFLRWIPHNINTYVDIGCGDGLDIAALGTRYRVNIGICVDVEDFRDAKYKRSKFVKVELGQPLDIPSASADLVTVFHSIHHMQDDVGARLADIIRTVKQGGRIFVKDHDVTDARIASNVDFEHLVYMLAESSVDLPDLVANFAAHEPMCYYPAATIHAHMKGCTRLWHGEINNRTAVYGAVYQKN